MQGIDYKLPAGVTLDTLVGFGRTVGTAFEAIACWDASDIRERLVEGDMIPLSEVDEAIHEFRKYLMCIIVARVTKAGAVGMMSKKVDEVWHNAILFTQEYFELSEKLLGKGAYLHHAPVVKSRGIKGGMNVFPSMYHLLFGKIPAIWGVRYATNELIWEDAMQGLCVTSQKDCDPVCVPDAPCAEGEGQLCEGSVTCSSTKDLFFVVDTSDCQGVCNPGDCTTPGQLCESK